MMSGGGSPDYEAAVGLIRHLTTDELKELVSNDSKTTDLIKDLPQMKNLVSEQEMLLASNKSLAEFNLSLEPKLSEAKQTLIAKYEEAAQLSEEVNKLKGQIDESSGQYSADTLHALLQTAAQETEEETENLVQSLLDKQQEVDPFVTEFLDKRKKAHLRRIKAEKISEINNTAVNNAHNSAALPSALPSALPYPPQGGGFMGAPQWTAYPPNPSMPMPGF